MAQTLGILTGGGDVPGLNAAICGLVRGAAERGWRTLGLRRGWLGPLAVDPADPASVRQHTQALAPAQVVGMERQGGTLLHTSRTHPARVSAAALPAHIPHALCRANDDGTLDATAAVLAHLRALGVDVLVPIGGDDTLSFAARLSAAGMPVVGLPKTMDNDVPGTDYCIGFGTCVARTVGYVQQLRTSAASHERVAVVEVMGRHSGASALVPALLADASRVLIAEVGFDIERLARLVDDDCRRSPTSDAVVLVSEGAFEAGGTALEQGEADAYGHRKLGGIGARVGAMLQARLGRGILNQSLGYLVRSGPPDWVDVQAGLALAHAALECIDARTLGALVVVRGGRIGTAPLRDVAGARGVDVARCYDAEAYRPRMGAMLGAPLLPG